MAAPVAERLRALFLNHSIISPLCLVWIRAPLWPHVRQAKFCLRVCQVVFLGVLPFSPHLLIGPSVTNKKMFSMFSIMRLCDGKQYHMSLEKCVKQTGTPFTVLTKLYHVTSSDTVKVFYLFWDG